MAIPNKKFKFELGQEVKEKITGFTGIIMSRIEYMTGCLQYGVCPRKVNDKGEMPEWNYIDQERLETTGNSVNINSPVGGPQPTPSKR